ncbi:Integrase catalytic core protein, partial [Phytophthora palmivora]
HDALTELLPVHGGAGFATVKTFQSLVGSLLWITRCTRPDVAFAVHKITWRTNAPTLGDWKLAKRVLCFLARTSTLKLHMKGNGGDNLRLDVVGYCDADYAGDKADRKSTTGGFVTVDGMAVSWVCKKQGGVSLSTMEAEYTAASVVTQELLGVRELLDEMKVSHEMSMQLIKFVGDFVRRGVLRAEYKAVSAPRILELRARIVTFEQLGPNILHVHCMVKTQP